MDPKEVGINMERSTGSAEDRDYWRVLANATLKTSYSISHGNT
jgi:hypothetical protein